jgi:hypothetical protein
MTYAIKCEFCTDEDYHLDTSFTDWCKKQQDIQYDANEVFNIEADHYIIQCKTSNKELAEELLKRLAIAFRTSFNRYQLQGQLFNITSNGIDFLKRTTPRPHEYYEEIGGNYEGTYVNIVKSR